MATPIPTSNKKDGIDAPTPINSVAGGGYHEMPGMALPGVDTIAEEGPTSSRIPEARALLVSGLRNKLNDLVGTPSGILDELSDEALYRCMALYGAQAEHKNIQHEFQRKVLDLEFEYANKLKPYFEKRRGIVNGIAKPTRKDHKNGVRMFENHEDGDLVKQANQKAGDTKSNDESESDEEYETEKVIAGAAAAMSDGPSEGIPHFWLTVLKSNPEMDFYIQEPDEAVLECLTDIRLDYLKPGESSVDDSITDHEKELYGFRLAFEFSTNEHFTNPILHKYYFYRNDECERDGEFQYFYSRGDTIEWKSEEKTLTERVIERKKQRNKNDKSTRIFVKTERLDSFFHFFKPPTPPKDENELDEEELEEFRENFGFDCDMGEIFKDYFIPHAIQFYTARAKEITEWKELDDEFVNQQGAEDGSHDGGEHGESGSDEDVSDDESGERRPGESPECKQS